MYEYIKQHFKGGYRRTLKRSKAATEETLAILNIEEKFENSAIGSSKCPRERKLVAAGDGSAVLVSHREMFFIMDIDRALIEGKKNSKCARMSDAKKRAINTVVSSSFERDKVLINVFFLAFLFKKKVRKRPRASLSFFLHVHMSQVKNILFLLTHTPVLASAYLWIRGGSSSTL